MKEKTGDADEMYTVECCYQNKIDIEKDKCKVSINYQKSADMDYADETKDPRNCHQNGIKVEKETSWNYQKNAEKDIVKSLKELDLEEKSEDDESDNVDDIDETSKEDHNEKNDKKGINKKKQHRVKPTISQMLVTVIDAKFGHLQRGQFG